MKPKIILKANGSSGDQNKEKKTKGQIELILKTGIEIV